MKFLFLNFFATVMLLAGCGTEVGNPTTGDKEKPTAGDARDQTPGDDRANSSVGENGSASSTSETATTGKDTVSSPQQGAASAVTPAPTPGAAESTGVQLNFTQPEGDSLKCEVDGVWRDENPGLHIVNTRGLEIKVAPSAETGADGAVLQSHYLIRVNDQDLTCGLNVDLSDAALGEMSGLRLSIHVPR